MEQAPCHYNVLRLKDRCFPFRESSKGVLVMFTHSTCIYFPLLYTSIVLNALHTISIVLTQPCPTLCGPMDCNTPGPSAHGISQAEILEWGAIFYSRGSS